MTWSSGAGPAFRWRASFAARRRNPRSGSAGAKYRLQLVITPNKTREASYYTWLLSASALQLKCRKTCLLAPSLRPSAITLVSRNPQPYEEALPRRARPVICARHPSAGKNARMQRWQGQRAVETRSSDSASMAMPARWSSIALTRPAHRLLVVGTGSAVRRPTRQRAGRTRASCCCRARRMPAWIVRP